VILRTNLFCSLEKLPGLRLRKRNSLDFGNLRDLRESPGARSRVYFDDSVLDSLVEYPADHAELIPYRVPRQVLGYQLVDQCLHIVAPYSFSGFVANRGRKYCRRTPS